MAVHFSPPKFVIDGDQLPSAFQTVIDSLTTSRFDLKTVRHAVALVQQQHTDENGRIQMTIPPSQAAVITLTHTAAVIASYAYTTILDVAIPLQQDIDYWQSIQDSTLWVAFELARDFPFQIVQWSKSILENPDHTFNQSWDNFNFNLLSQAQKKYQLKLQALKTIQYTHAIGLGLFAAGSADLQNLCSSDVTLNWALQCLNITNDVLGQILDTDSPIRSGIEDLPSLQKFMQAFEESVGKLERYQQYLTKIQSEYGRPGIIHSYWLQSLLTIYAINMSQQGVTSRWDEIALISIDIWQTVHRFAAEYLYRPLLQMYTIVRYDRHELTLVSADSIRADIESLERMLRDFRVDRRLVQLPTDSTEQILGMGSSTIHQADLDMMMHYYEQELREPLKSFFFGDLSRLLLLQVQKTKVDLELAMTALDKLLRANELNFILLTLIPAVFLTSTALFQLTRLWRQRQSIAAWDTHRVIRDRIRNVDVILNRNNHDSKVKLPPAEQGYLLMEVRILRSCTATLPSSDQNKFACDLQEIEDVLMTIQQRLTTVHRMYRTYPVVLGLVHNSVLL